MTPSTWMTPSPREARPTRSDTARLALLGAALLLTAMSFPTGAAARQRPTEAELEARLEALAPRVEAARLRKDAAVEADRTRRAAEAPKLEEYHVGGMRLSALPDQVSKTRALAEGVWNTEYAFMSGSDWSSPDATVIHWGPPREGFERRVPGETRIWGGTLAGEYVMQEGVRDVLGHQLRSAAAGNRLVGWAGEPIRRPRDPERTFRVALISGSTTATQCMTGSDDACLVALGLDVDAYPIDDWYTPAERALIARAVPWEQMASSQEGSEAWSACQEGRQDGCDRLLELRFETVARPLWSAPLEPSARTGLLWFALQTGGPGAWSRLRSMDAAEPAAALEAVSGMELADLIPAWRAWMESGRPPTHDDVGTASAGTFAWALLISIFALRSTRWRFG